MRRLLMTTAAVLLAAGAFAVPAAAAPAAGEPRPLCDVNDNTRLPAITGIASVPGGFVVVTEQPSALRLYKLDTACKPTKIFDDSALTPHSIQDLARTPDGALWVADIGDLKRSREILVIDKVAPNARKATKFRLSYPDGAHDAAALVVAANGVPVIITREAQGPSKLYTTAGPLSAQTTPLKAAGSFTVPASNTSGGKYGKVSQQLVSGAALSPDGKRVIVRTLTDAYEWDVTGDLATTIASGKPRVTPLPNESDGESITYTSDGAGFVTANDGHPATLREWSPAPLPDAGSPVKAASARKIPAKSSSILDNLTLDQLGGLVLGAGAVGLLLLVAGIVGIVRFRRTRGESDEPGLDARIAEARARNQGYAGDQPEQIIALPPMGAPMTSGMPPGGPGRGTVYGGEQPARGGTVYGGRPEPEQQRGGTVYGGNPHGSGAANGTTYGAPPPNGTTYGSGPARGTTYGGPPEPAGPRQGQVYGRPAAPPPAAPQRPLGNPAGNPGGAGQGGSVYGDRSAGATDSRGLSDAVHEVPQRSPRDWRSRRPPD